MFVAMYELQNLICTDVITFVAMYELQNLICTEVIVFAAMYELQNLICTEVLVIAALYPIVEKLGSGYTFFTVFVGLRGTKDELDLPSSNIWYCWK